MEQSLAELRGTIERIIFQSSESGFCVLVLSHQHLSTIVKGFLSSAQAGQEITVLGSWVTHPKFGKQFEAKQCIATLPTTTVGLKKFLGSGAIKGIGPAYADRLVAAFGDQVLTVIDTDPSRLELVDGIGKKRAEQIVQSWREQRGIANIMVFLQEKGISPAFSHKIFRRYGHEAVALISQNPYRLADDIWGVGFKTADRIAQQLGIDPLSIARIKAGIAYCLGNAVTSGNLYMQIPTLKEQAIALLELPESESEILCKRALTELFDDGKIKIVTHEENHYLTLSQYYYTEYGVAQKIKELIGRTRSKPIDVDAIYQQLRVGIPGSQLQLNDDQQRGIMMALQETLSIITGGPGTGKTTLVRQLLAMLDTLGIHYKLAAPTGRAAKRLYEGTGRTSVTLHRLLEFDPSAGGFNHTEKNTLPVDFLIIDEASMIDIFLAHAVLKALPPTAQILFIGDVDQLPSVGAGNFLSDLLQSGKVPSVRLNQIFRQATHSMIVVNAHRINQGEFPIVGGATNDFIWIDEQDPEQVPAQLATLYKKKLPALGIARNQSIVLVPMNRGHAGTINLNKHLQAIINSQGTPELEYRGTVYRCGDQVMQIRNNYEKMVFNGDIGIIEQIDLATKDVYITISDRTLLYQFDELDEILLAYAITIHKSQGSEYSAVIVPLFTQHFALLQRNLVYTALTRAKKVCIFIGQKKALAIALKKVQGTTRMTLLQQYITTDLQCRA
ncbi:ATP-dependent RecD-like DNA helicase [Candidatus Dependentiae bacterium]|nr:ATP-dependent RecD-like DNA helicase [Candidatus Dependentiae bacterium]